MAKLCDAEWHLLEAISETYALPGSPSYMDPEAFNRFLRSRIPARGKRFAHDHRDTCAYIERSKNANVVAYTANYIVPAGSPEATKATTPHPTDSAFEAERLHYERHYHGTHQQRNTGVPAGMVPVPSGRGIACQPNLTNPAHAYFVRLEPSYIEARRKKGIQGDCDELKMLERKFAYGYNTKRFEPEKHVKEQLPTHMKGGGALQAALAAAAASDAASPEVHRQAVLEGLASWWKQTPSLIMSFAPLPVWPAFAITLPPLPPSSSPTAKEEGAEEEGGATVQEPWLHDEDTTAVLVAMIEGQLCVLEKVYVKSVEHWFGLPTVDYIEVFGTCLADGLGRRDKQLASGKYEAPKNVTPEDIANS